MPFAFSFASEALILASNSVSPLRTPMPTEPTVVGLVALDDARLGKAALLQIVGEDRIIGEAGLEAARRSHRAEYPGMVS